MMILPDYDNSILSTVASVMKAYGLPSGYPTLPVLDEMLADRPKNIVILLLDGLGVTTLEEVLPQESFLRRHHVHTVTSVVPSTTTAATTAYATGLSPNEHAWLGWSLYFKECAQQLDIFRGTVTHWGHKFSPQSPAYRYMPYETLFSRIRKATEDRVRTVDMSPYPDADCGATETVTCSTHSFPNMLDRLEKLLKADKGEQYIYAYWPDPDSEAHGSGPLSDKSRALVKQMNAELEQFARRIEGTDTLLIISADHGLRGNMRPVYINRIPEIMDCLIMPPSIELRAATFFVKPHRKAQFEEAFRARFGETFVLFTREEVLEKQLFGRGQSHPKVDDFLGDYLACAIGDEYIEFAALNEREEHRFRGAHAGLSREEMLVPVIPLRFHAKPQ